MLHKTGIAQGPTPPGYVPGTDMEVAKKVDLIVLPQGVPGTNCSNCKYAKPAGQALACQHPKVKQNVTPRNCCALWDNQAVARPWGAEQTAKEMK